MLWRTSHAEGVVNDQRNTVVVRDLLDRVRMYLDWGIYCSQSYLSQLRERGDVVLGVADALYVDRLRLLVDRGSESLGLWAVYELGADVEALQEHCNESELHVFD